MAFPVPELRIAEAEAALGRPLPGPLRVRLLRDNGGEVEAEGDDWRIHPVWDPTDHRTSARTASHVVLETASAREWHGFPPDGIALASDGGGNFIIVLGDSDAPQRWDHETGEMWPIAVDWR